MVYDIRFKRVYESAEKSDGARVLVDRVWPRGKRKEALALTEWYKDASPTPALRKAWHSGEMNDGLFEHNYREQLQANPDVLTPLLRHARQGRLTLLTASRDPDHSHLPVLRKALLQQLAREDEEADGREPSSPTCYEAGD